MKKSAQRPGNKLYLLLAATLVGGGLLVVGLAGQPATPAQAEPRAPQTMAEQPAPPAMTEEIAPPQEGTRASERAPALVFEQTSVAIGTIQEGEVVEIVFPVKNTGDAPIRIVEIRAGCGCTATKGNPTSIAPGEESAIKVQFDSRGRLGPNNRSVSIFTDDPNRSEYRLSFEGHVKTDLMLSTQMLNFHEMELGKGASLEFILTSTSEKPVKIISAKAEDERIVVEHLSETETVTGNDKEVAHKFKVTVPEEMPQGDFYTRVVVTTDHGKAPIQYVNLRGRVMGNFDFSPNRLFAVMNTNTELERRLTIVSRNGQSFEVDEFEQNVDIPIELTIEPGATAQEKVLVAVFSAPDTAKTINGNVRLFLKQGEEGKISPLDIPVIAVVRDQRPAAAAPAAQTSSAAPAAARATP